MKRVFLVSDSFKGSLSATDINKNLTKGLLQGNPLLDIISAPLCDGGEGTLDTLTDALSGRKISFEVHDPLGRNIKAQAGIVDDETAIVEMAQASGIERLSVEELNPMQTSTYGTGELIDKLIGLGYKKIILTLGGSATVDGGTGIVQALGGKFYHSDGALLPPNSSPLFEYHRCDLSGFLKRTEGVAFTVVVDVQNPLLGEHGAAAVFGPQKGVRQHQMQDFDHQLLRWAQLLEKHSGKKLTSVKGSGAAGGALLPFLMHPDTKVVSGFSMVSELLNYEQNIKKCDVLITGEGSVDDQSFMGKGVGKLIDMAHQYHKDVILVVGQNQLTDGKNKSKVNKVCAIADMANSLSDAMENTPEYLTQIGFKIGREL
ncbi:glycerate kinase [Labilibacter sediminis]|nr:glycerate kinase [Labilibacter sediminis]